MPPMGALLAQGQSDGGWANERSVGKMPIDRRLGGEVMMGGQIALIKSFCEVQNIGVSMASIHVHSQLNHAKLRGKLNPFNRRASHCCHVPHRLNKWADAWCSSKAISCGRLLGGDNSNFFGITFCYIYQGKHCG
jgi:hypothetical protein